MPAVSIYDPIVSRLHSALNDSDLSKIDHTDDLSIKLVSSAPRIMQTEIPYEEFKDFQQSKNQVKANCNIFLNLSSSETVEESKVKDSISCKKNDAHKGLILPEPAVVLYPSKKVHLGWRSTFPVGAGMFNVGNTCYLNSTLQALYHVPALVNWLLSDSHHNSKCEQNDENGDCLTCAVAKTLQFSHLKSGSAFKPFFVYNKLKLICRTMVPGQQEDAHEFLRYLLEGMERVYLIRHKGTKLDTYSKETTPINQIFGGYIRTEVKCLQCQHISTTFQHFQDLLVDVRKVNTLDEALSSYFSKEQLDNNDYKCEACKRKVPATKQFILQRPPKVLCVQLKRFSVLGTKISKQVGFKQTIDMGPYLWREPGESPKQLIYKLTSMITHIGPSVNCGHYTAIAQVSNGDYYSFDDSFVRPISLNSVLSTNAYIIIFEMENGSHSQQTVKSNGVITKNASTSLLNSTNKSFVSKASTSAGCTINESLNVELSNGSDNDSKSILIGPQLPPQKNIELNLPLQKSNNAIGVQKTQNKGQPRLVMHIKNGKILNGNSLVPYDGSSEEEDNSLGIPKNQISNTTSRINTTNQNVPKYSVTKDAISKTISNSKEVQKTNFKNSSNGMSTTATTVQTQILQYTKSQNGSNSNGRISLLKHQNGKVNDGQLEQRDKDMWHQSVKTKTKQEVVPTKATSNSKSWQISKNTSPLICSGSGEWLITDNKEEIKLNSTLSAAAVRDFNGTNRSVPNSVSYLLKLSHRGYSNSSVTNWNGNKTQLDREVDNERREERKRYFNADDEEIDRGRMKKIKNHNRRAYEERSNSSTNYNLFQEYQNKSWNRSVNSYHRRHYYNTSNTYGRSRHGNNSYRPLHHRYHSYRYL